MRKLVNSLALCLFLVVNAWADSSFYALEARSLEGDLVEFSQYKGKVLVVVNTAVHCGFTAQLSDLQKLYEKYQDQGLVVLGFPSADFSEKEKESDKQVKKFCRKRYGVSFPMFSKDRVVGPKKQAVYKFLTEEGAKKFKGEIGFTFEKFLIDRKGKIRDRFGSFTNPNGMKMTDAVEALLAEKL